MNRRKFLKTASLSAAALAMDRVPAIAQNAQTKSASQSSNAPQIPRREYGKTGIRLSVIGLGGVVVSDMEQEHANYLVAEAVERGVNYFDVSPSYGHAEQTFGSALKPFRKNVFLACKTGHRGSDGARSELNQSLKRLNTDYLDLYQLHAIKDVKGDVDAAFAKGGAMEVFIEAKKSGQIRHLGFSAHSIEAAFAAMDRYDFDSILFPVNFACFYKGGFGPQIIKKAESKAVARLALKAMARQEWPKNDPQRKKYSKCWYQPISDPHEAELALSFSLSQSITAAIAPGEESLFRLAMELAPKIKPITDKEEKELEKLAATLNPVFPIA